MYFCIANFFSTYNVHMVCYRKLLNVGMYNLWYIILCPILSLVEVGIAAKNALLQRDFGFFQDTNQVSPKDGKDLENDHDH